MNKTYLLLRVKEKAAFSNTNLLCGRRWGNDVLIEPQTMWGFFQARGLIVKGTQKKNVFQLRPPWLLALDFIAVM